MLLESSACSKKVQCCSYCAASAADAAGTARSSSICDFTDDKGFEVAVEAGVALPTAGAVADTEEAAPAPASVLSFDCTLAL